MHQTGPETTILATGELTDKSSVYREHASDALWPQGQRGTENITKVEKEANLMGPPSSTHVITFYLAQSTDDSAKRIQLPTFASAIWSVTNQSLLAANQEFCFCFGYAPTVLSNLTWRHLVLTDGTRSDPKDIDILEESHRRITVIHNLLQAGKLQSCSARLSLINNANTVLFCHLQAVTLYDDHGAPNSILWLLKKLPHAGVQLPPETNIGEALREASILSYEQSESKLVEIKRKKPPPTESRKPWDNNLAKFSLKRVKRPDDPTATNSNRSGGSASSSSSSSNPSGSPLPPKTISVVNPFSIAHLQPHSMNAHDHTAQLLEPSDYDYVAPHSPPPVASLSHHHTPFLMPQNQLSRRMSDPTSQHIRKVMPLNQLSRHNSAEFPKAQSYPASGAPQHVHTQHQLRPPPPPHHMQQQPSQHTYPNHQYQIPQQQQHIHLSHQQQMYMNDHPQHVEYMHSTQPAQVLPSMPQTPPPQHHHLHHHHQQPMQLHHLPQHQPPHSDISHHHQHSAAMPPPMQTSIQYVVDCNACAAHQQTAAGPPPQGVPSHYYVTDSSGNANKIGTPGLTSDTSPSPPPAEQPPTAPHTIDPRNLLHQANQLSTPHGPPNPEVFYEPHLPASPRT